MRVRVLACAAAGLALGVGLAGCSDSKSSSGGSGSGSVKVTATDTECQVANLNLPAGTHVFSVTNTGSKVTEFYVYAEGDRVVGEVENIAPGVSRDLHVELAAGSYQAACKPGMVGDGIRSTLTVSGSAAALSEDALLAQAGKDYQQYVSVQVDGLVAKTGEFVAAVKAGDIAKAKQLYPVARTYYERIEPVAESFGDLDPEIDARDGDIAPGTDWTGFHKLEQDLWAKNDVSGSGAVADKLNADVAKLKTLVASATFKPLELANGAKELLDEVATSKVTGEEDRYSHTDLWDFQGNVDGSKAAVAALRPALDQRDPALGKTLDAQFAAVQAELDRYHSGEQWKLYTQLTPDQVKALSDAINGLAEPISKLAATISQ
jgi:iron uptake system component EfeO